MSDKSLIEWTDATWNPITGCSVVSPGCTNCYAMRLAGTRLKHHPTREGLTVESKAGPVWNGQVRFNEQALGQPLHWPRPRKIFVCAHGDLFAEQVPEAWIDRVFAVMALCPQHTFQVLTKRPARMRAYLSDSAAIARIYDEVCDVVIGDNGVAGRIILIGPGMDESRAPPGPRVHLGTWPLSNVWLGTSVEDQRRADERIPELLATPAAMRFISAEPLLGPLNIRAALRPVQPFTEEELPAEWVAFAWPEWVPAGLREWIADFWREQWGRGPKSWLRDAISQGGPALWSHAEIWRLTIERRTVAGRFVHLWNNIGCVVHEDGTYTSGAFVGSGVYTSVIKNGRGLDWVIVGSESGPQARPCDIEWVRSLRDQCVTASTAFFWKQHVEGGRKLSTPQLDGRTWIEFPQTSA